MNEYKDYIKKARQPMRPYVEGENLSAQGVYVWEEHVVEVGGMIAVNPEDPKDCWYIPKSFFESNYMLAEDIE